MKKYHVSEIYKFTSNGIYGPNETENDKIETLQGMIGAAAACKSFEFFGIEITDNDMTINVPDEFDLNNAINVIDGYLIIVENDECNNSESYEYDKYTEPYRGADDGTFDYAGGYVDIIFQAMKKYDELQN